MARRGIFSRIASAVRGVFTREPPRRAPVPPPPAPPPTPPRRRRVDPYRETWNREIGRTRPTGYLQHRDIIDDMALEYNLDEQDKQELWEDYLHYMVGRRGVRQEYRRNDIRNPFWQNWGIDPDSFDWSAWREAIGDSPIV